MIKRETILADNKRLLEKHRKTNAIIESLIQSRAEMAEIEEIRMQITPEEYKTLNSVTEHCNK